MLLGWLSRRRTRWRGPRRCSTGSLPPATGPACRSSAPSRAAWWTCWLRGRASGPSTWGRAAARSPCILEESGGAIDVGIRYTLGAAPSRCPLGRCRSEHATHGVAEGLLGVDARRVGLGDQREQAVTEGGLGGLRGLGRRRDGRDVDG